MTRNVASKELAELNRILRAVPDHSARTEARYDELKGWFSQVLGVPEDLMKATFISGGKQVGPRLTTPGIQLARPRLAIGVLGRLHELEACFKRVQLEVGSGPEHSMGALVLVGALDEQQWSVVGLVEPEGGPLEKPLRALFPSLEVSRPVTGGPGPDRETTEYTTATRQGLPLPRVGENTYPGLADVTWLADELGIPSAWLDEVRASLEEKKSLVFYGPPGTGKTFIARRLAEALQPRPNLRAFVQLHPSYGYEDLFEGYRPQPGSGGISLTKRPGPLRKLVEQAEQNPAEPVVLVLDEMNRGNLPKVFGELYFLLEYRGESISLMYSPDESFKLPKNLLVLGAMNTADRSIVLLDQALRRRFAFISLFPGEPPVDRMLRTFLSRRVPQMAWVADLLDLVNEKLDDRNSAIGPSHFMRSDLSEAVLARVWRHNILPALEDHFFSNRRRLDDFALPRLVEEARERSREE
ncbi:5-methylcytosine-specific restriction enzyme B [Myxococcus stipitatus DSM 14675]|uniref:5-methylcytosine-specific restriction enzyme B n=1 Tax=Myxococcus stipitatus (strain DSM 14675 / JCM 12634 / Mx s8) TaxID=1278073 RepID=L7UGR6_MYXSD|nr:AAA family ATPase [Myxococcus stipitatus]AGC47223.1 5-methylcytosine-specific restriction enzyme B [Myxococcus stipitatus DSM 14675]